MIRLLLTFCFTVLLVSQVSAKHDNDTLSVQKKSKTEDQDPKKKKTTDQKPEEPKIKEVPKAKRQVKPMAVKPNVKIKPIRIVKPKIKRP